ncbi:MAG TPA: NAD(P)H-dependent oxidoreductase [Rhodocyclaceae bacterium]|nr:NAD(P)H-dependent oxidoreductase [Rhodocyclaceae bacterium]HRQ45481.1 NAD(P)H-dependent oxidoreductase [Rhodocyclaceae bacterium]
MKARKHLLIVYHSQSGNTARLADAVMSGCRRVDEVDSRMLRAADAGTSELLDCDGLILGTPENFGYMSGALKDFFDRTYYPCEGKLTGLPYALFVSAGNDGSGAVREVARIAAGYGWKLAAEPVIVRGPIGDAAIANCDELGEAMASGIALGVF